jgi:hypothetical protein
MLHMINLSIYKQMTINKLNNYIKKISLIAILALAAQTAWADDLDNIRDAITDKINQLRATQGLAPLARWTEGVACANISAEKDSKANQPHGSEESKGGCRGDASAFGQNTLANYWLERAFMEGLNTLQESLNKGLDKMWAEGASGIHYQNMSNPSFKRVAVGIYVNPDDNPNRSKYWINMNFSN